MSEKVIVVGAGAAGLMAAGTAAERGFDVLLIERNDKVARKVMITGKGRCNVTNNCNLINDLIANVPTNGRFLYGAFSKFNINYANGLSRLATAEEWNGNEPTDNPEDLLRLPTASDTFKINTKSKKIHITTCSGVSHITDTCTGDMIAALKANGYTMCGQCDPFLEEVWDQIGANEGGEDNGSGDNNDGTGEEGTEEGDALQDHGLGTEGGEAVQEILFILNTSSKVIHNETHGQTVSEQNRLEYRGTKDSVLEDNPGYHACGTCKPLD